MARSSASKRRGAAAAPPPPPPVEEVPHHSDPGGPTAEEEIRSLEAQLNKIPQDPPPPPPPGAQVGKAADAIASGDPKEIREATALLDERGMADLIALVFGLFGDVRAYVVARKYGLTKQQVQVLSHAYSLPDDVKQRLGEWVMNFCRRHGVEVTAGILGDILSAGVLAGAIRDCYHRDIEAMGKVMALVPAGAS